ncbi:MAG TPA: 4-hydroxy-3-methylbut-2-enyl diphosphate reductase [Bacteroidia bacterium]|nr:4-hydroxy-3-methylbut-2-enyl diphosphate reductase [Bacteroidia bacterium]
MKSFNIPEFYRSPVISKIKALRKAGDPKKKDFSPTVLDFGPAVIYIARHFGFCYGVENAVEISFRSVEENPGKRIFLLSQMIHNPEVNNDLTSRGVRFIMDTNGKQLIPWSELTKDDIVIIPAFGTTLAIESHLHAIGIQPERYNTTCPFVERVWKKSAQLGEGKFTIIIHGKPAHEETRATFSHSAVNGPSIVVKDMSESVLLGNFILGKIPREEFEKTFSGRTSPGFDPQKDLDRIGVINQTTMLAAETQAIADHFKKVMEEKFGALNSKDHFADTRDTLCYATNENQDATYGLLETNADLAVVVGGYNSSNTSHLVELCEQRFPTYFIKDETEIISGTVIRHFDLHTHEMKQTQSWLPGRTPVRIVLSSGASCPDSVVERVLNRLLSFFENARKAEAVLAELEAK